MQKRTVDSLLYSSIALLVFHSWFHLLSLANLQDGGEIAAC